MTALQQHFTPAELGRLWGVSHHTIRRAFREYPGVLRIKIGRKNEMLRIPESVAAAYHQEKSLTTAQKIQRGGR